MKCSQCGADVPAVNLQHSWKQLLLVVPVLLLGFWPLAQLTILRGDATKDLVIRQVKKNLVFRIHLAEVSWLLGSLKTLVNMIGRALPSRQNSSTNRVYLSMRPRNIFAVI